MPRPATCPRGTHLWFLARITTLTLPDLAGFYEVERLFTCRRCPLARGFTMQLHQSQRGSSPEALEAQYHAEQRSGTPLAASAKRLTQE